MEPRVKILISVVIGGVAGYFVGSFIASKFADDEYEIIEVSEVEEVVEEKEPKRKLPPRQMRVGDRHSILTRDYTSHFEKGKVQQPDLEKLAARYNGKKEVIRASEDTELVNEAVSQDEDMEEKGLNILPEEEEVDELAPKVISEQEYNERPEVKGYVKTVLHYYAKDDVTTDESDEPVPNPEKFIGDEALVSFGKMSNDPNIVYVYNPATMDLFQINRLDKSWSADVYGEHEGTRAKRRPPRKGRKEDAES